MKQTHWHRPCRPHAASPNGVQVYHDGQPVRLIRRSEAIKLEHLEVAGVKIAEWRGRRKDTLTLLASPEQLSHAIHVMRHFRLRSEVGAMDNKTCIRIPGPTAYRHVPQRCLAYSPRVRAAR